MAIIALEGMHFRAMHGFYPEENIVGNDFVLDVYVETEISSAAMTDELYEELEDEDAEEDAPPLTVNYETLYLICENEMRKTSKLLETVVQRIATRLHNYFTFEQEGEQIPLIRGARVRLRKLHPPLNGKVDSAYVEVSTGSFKSSGRPSMFF